MLNTSLHNFLLMLLLSITLAFFSATTNAGEVIKSTVSLENGIYTTSLVMHINAPTKKVYALMTNYDSLSRLSDNITNSEIIDEDHPEYTIVVSTHNCVLFFCIDLTQTQLVLEIDGGYIAVEDIKGKSDFTFAESYWHIYADKKGTRVTFNSEMKPGFWLPPLIGPWYFKRQLLEETKSMIERLEKLATNGH